MGLNTMGYLASSNDVERFVFGSVTFVLCICCVIMSLSSRNLLILSGLSLALLNPNASPVSFEKLPSKYCTNISSLKSFHCGKIKSIPGSKYPSPILNVPQSQTKVIQTVTPSHHSPQYFQTRHVSHHRNCSSPSSWRNCTECTC